MRRGIPLRLYVDNGSAFRSHHLALVCARLGITPAAPAPGLRLRDLDKDDEEKH